MWSDPKLDAQLQAVPTPEGLLDRLRALPLTEDDDLDAAVRELPLPAGLLKRLQAVPLADDRGLDQSLRNVPVPRRLLAAWRRRAKESDRLIRLSRIAVAASVLLALTLSFFSTMILSLAGWHWPLSGPAPIAQMPSAPREKLEDVGPLEFSWGADPSAPDGAPAPAPLAASPRVALEEIGSHRTPASPDDLGAGFNLPLAADPLLLPSNGVYGFGNSFDELRELPRRVADLVPRGLAWPLVPNGNQAFLIRYGFHPFVSPAANPRLQTCQVPLGVDGSSYELARRYVEDGFLPPPDLVRTEDFLAAVDYEFAKPASKPLGLTAAAGPSPISGEGFCLLQIGVQGRELSVQPHPAAQLVLLVDTSASMRWGSRIQSAGRALRDMAGWLGPADRVSLVSFNQGAHVLVQDVGAGEIGPFMAAVDSLSAEGSTEVSGGLREAFSLAQSVTGGDRPPVCVVMLTDGLLELDHPSVERIEHQVAEAAGRGVSLHVVDMGQQKQGDPQLAQFAKAGHGDVRRATNADQVRWALREILTGRSQSIARDARLQVTFNPKTVIEYRLLGHEAKEWAGMMPGPTQADFREGQSATALYEVRLAAKGPDEVASAELSWYVPGGDKQPHRATLRIERKDFAPSLAKAPLSLQEAAVVAQTAEALGRSPFVLARTPQRSTPKALLRTFELAGLVDSRLSQRPSFNEFMTLLEQSLKAKPAPSGTRKR